ncbi:uncharacterized protein LOC120359958 [Solenopsis invicta]|uniref:uncharacterized protein LOC120359958 n=1 Tax=Solenopsis invicta TaxID=13686 RepID=UPI00193E9D00|nr:uncharacterized protein LOC120359958 [Solenopsis invicta]
MARLREVAEYKKGLKGTTQKALREIATLAEEAVKVMAGRSQTEEVYRLQLAYDRQKRELDAFKAELESVKKQLSEALATVGPNSGGDRRSASEDLPVPLQPSVLRNRRRIVSSDEEDAPVATPEEGRPNHVRRSPPVPAGSLTMTLSSKNGDPGESTPLDREEKLLDALLRKVGAMVDAKLEGIRDRLLPEKSYRPPLAFEKGVSGAAGGGRSSASAPPVAPLGSSERIAKAGTGSKPPIKGRESRAAPSTAASSQIAVGAAKATSSSSTSDPPAPREFWTEVVGRRARKKGGKGAGPAVGSVPTGPSKKAGTVGSAQSKKGEKGKNAEVKAKTKAKAKVKVNVPKRAAIVLTAVDGAKISVADALAKVRNQIDLRSMGITSLRPRRALTGAIMYEVPGEQSQEGAERLESRLREILNPEEVKVSRPIKTAELRLSGLDDLTDVQDVAEAMARVGGCAALEVQVGTIRRPRNGLGSVWLRCPAAAARKLAQAGSVQVGWVMARVEALRPRPAQCYRCLRAGHTIGSCDSPVDRSNLCYRCGQSGHVASRCEEALRCPVCADLGRPAEHRFGGPACTPPPPAKKVAANKAESRKATAGPSTAPQVNAEGGSLEEAMEMEL